MSSNPGKTTSYDVAQMVGRVFPLVFINSSSTLSGFTASGIYPLNQDFFSVIACVRPVPTGAALKEPSTSKLQAASQSLLDECVSSSRSKIEATVLPNMK
jgi:hypothetical protein